MNPTEINFHRQSKVIELTFDDGSHFNLPCEFLRVYSPSAEVQGHGPGQRVLQLGNLDGQNEYQVFNDRFGKPFKVYKIKDASDFLGGKYSIFVVNVKDGSIIAAEFSEGAWHADLVRFVDPDHTVDDYVRGYVLTNVDKGLSFSTVYAGVEFRNLNDRAGENRAIDNIYKALDRLVSKGLPKNTKVTINMLDGKELFTTAKSLINIAEAEA